MTMADSTPAVSPWVVLKFGGTSVSSVANWKNVAAVVRDRLAEGMRPVLVHSALSGITDRLEQLLAISLASHNTLGNEAEGVMNQIEQRHRDLARDLGVTPSQDLEEQFKRLRQIAAGIALVGEVSERLRARVMAQGELMATRLGAAFLAAQGLDVQWIDARTVLKAEQRRNANLRSSYLSATCNYEPDLELQRRWSSQGTVFITQGFIASDEQGDTVLLGRGGSDTSGSYFAAKLGARRLEIWTDVPGMFSANPRSVPTARLLRALEYDEAQEIASSGAKVLHPRCIMPVKQYGIPLYVYATQTPKLEGTVITTHGGNVAAQVKAVTIKKNITLVSMETVGMWHSVGFLADAFQVFKNHGLSIDLVSTSETSVTVSLDPAANTMDKATLDALVVDLGKLCRVEVIGPCAAVSLVGRNIRAILHRLGDALELFEEQKIYLVTQAANDLNITFVIDEEQGDRLVSRLHDIAIQKMTADRVLGPTWEELYGPKDKAAVDLKQWWHDRRNDLISLGREHGAAFVYDRETLTGKAKALRALPGIEGVFYALKANWHPEILKLFAEQGLGFECVSRAEVEHVMKTLPKLDKQKILFTPNFAPRAEYEWGVQQGIWVTLDNLHPLKAWPEVFKGRDVFIRIDTGYGRGHHDKVRTAGVHSKFGVPLFEMDELERLVKAAGARVVGLHAHTGSGVFTVDNWKSVGDTLTALTDRFKDVRIVDLGGGLGVPERLGQQGVKLSEFGETLAALKAAHPKLTLWIEPGRYLVAEAGVLLAQVTQLKGKGEVNYVGVATGMNSLIRPALYGAHHEIVNLTRLDDLATEVFNVVGPICESGDQLGNDRLLPPTQEGDVLLIATAGAYGRAMSSTYNLREPAIEVLI
ncbi:bifunctional aspartate kinase/diaminopimelate decarboxylase [Steroidobacter cummioxidans]|uniref:bifunctional aspartate kinase/diaminopimelate decarboxylase n=1 Tax=Steroidobacter cummioxidans TaxID=1803913 RepID=UPI0019D46E86|nr:bifunctional aspartate kinase/diaminopimelate decarboxylase [Steroidobacter cummioxidans]